MEMYTQAVIGGLVSSAPPLVGWIVAVVLAAIMLRRGRGRAERFLLAGASLMLVQSLIAITTTAVSTWLIVDRGMAIVEAASMLSVFGLVRGCIGLAGIICLVYAFWVKFGLGKGAEGVRLSP
ncbi:hypothetical protein ES703_44380 [subsurface metagenome]